MQKRCKPHLTHLAQGHRLVSQRKTPEGCIPSGVSSPRLTPHHLPLGVLSLGVGEPSTEVVRTAPGSVVRKHKKGGRPNPPWCPLRSRNALNAYPVGRGPPVCVKQSEFYVSPKYKMSSKRPSGLRSANQDKKFRRAHKWYLRSCFLRGLRNDSKRVASEVPSLGSD